MIFYVGNKPIGELKYAGLYCYGCGHLTSCAPFDCPFCGTEATEEVNSFKWFIKPRELKELAQDSDITDEEGKKYSLEELYEKISICPVQYFKGGEDGQVP